MGMSREEAINRLRNMIIEISDYCNASKHMSESDRQDMETFDMAIKALEQEPTADNDSAVDTNKLLETCEKMSFDFELFGRPTKALLLDAVKNIVNDLLRATPQEPKPMVEIDLYSVIKQKYIEREVLDKIRSEIEQDAFKDVNDSKYIFVNRVNQILDKYKAESEET